MSGSLNVLVYLWLAECAVLSMVGGMCCFIYGWLNILFYLWLAE